ncbi:MAG: hypothetical protein N3B16_06865 [Candidatus Aminicenantes bacterium]|nr:hypothetical protein [Candidatus Aminicenantes bacterium]
MGIKRCPYCRALVEEEALYCRNCGTQLLFPEDENIEEDIPGEKDLFEPDERRVFEERIKLEEEFLEAKDREEIDEGEKMKIKIGRSRKRRYQEEDLDEFLKKEAEEKFMAKEPIDEENEERLLEKETKPELAEVIENQRKAETESLDFPTVELDRLTRSVDEGQKKLEEFLEFLKEKASSGLERGDKEKGEDEFSIEEKGQLPPWAEAIKNEVETGSSSLTDLSSLTAQEDDFETQPEKSSPTWQVDSGVGLPERPDQQSLPFIADELEKEAEEAEEKEKEELDEETRRPFVGTMKRVQIQEEKMKDEKNESDEDKPLSRPFSCWLKAKLFDLIFIGLLWFIAFALAARIVAWSFFSLVAVSAFQAIVFFLILFGGYLFLFRYFIGETLGDRIFSPGD